MRAKAKGARRGRPAGKPLSRRELAARRANLLLARAAPKDLIYRPTAKRLAASLKNLRKAMTARRSQEGNDRVRLNALRHGVFSRELIDESVSRLGEDRREFERHRELFACIFVPHTEDEAAIVYELSNIAWRRLRLFRAAAERERRDLRRAFERYCEPGLLDAQETLSRMYLVLDTLDNCTRVLKDAARLRDEIQQLVRMLIEGRKGIEYKSEGNGQKAGSSGLEAEDDWPYLEAESQRAEVRRTEVDDERDDSVW